jgi:hypothetical protein
MAKLHIIGIGGTGHKVLQAAIHLAACGVFKGKVGQHEINEIRVLTIDADDANGNLSLTKKTLGAYQAFYRAISGGEFGLVNIEGITKELNISLYDGEKNSVGKTFGVAKFAGSGEEKLLRFLYTDAEINAAFNQGFYGHTAIGTLIVEDILNNKPEWNDFQHNITDNDFVVVTGSIFGGTGASAIPVVLEKLDALKKKKPFYLTAIMLTPYFNTIGEINEEGELQPDSRNFQIKAKAGLYYYHAQERYKLTDSLYIIGEPEVNYSNEIAARGASKQRNKTHPLELFAAAGIFDFIAESKDRVGSRIITADRDVSDKGEHCYTWNMAQNAGQNFPAAMQNLLRMAIFYNKILYNDIKNQNGPGIWQDLYDKGSPDEEKLHHLRDDSKNLLFENIYGYFSLFVQWMYDLHKRNLNEIDKTQGAMKWEPDTRMRFFNIVHKEMFDNEPVKNDTIRNFDELVYNERDARKAEWIYAKLCETLPAKNKQHFAALFDNLFELVEAPQKKGLFGKKSDPVLVKYTTVPYLSQENNVAFQRGVPAANKMWTSSDPDLLRDIADGLPNTVGKSFTRNDLSIPSPWSIFIMNELTLSEEKFRQINKDAFNQWCGLLALIALRKLNRYEQSGLKLERLEYAFGSDAFINTVRDTCTPQSYIFGDQNSQNWTDCVRVSLNGKTIAFLANNTLVCPAYAYDAETRAFLYKIAPTIVNPEGKFQPPSNYFADNANAMNRDAKYALSLFLNDLQRVLTRMAANNQKNIIGCLQAQANAFLAALGNVVPNSFISIMPGAHERVTSVETLFELLCPASSNTTVELPFLLDGAAEPVVLIGLNICGISSASPDAANILITDDLLYNHINAATIPDLRGQIKDNIRLVWDSDLLADSMVMITKGGSRVFEQGMPNSSLPAEYEIIWPVCEDLAKWFSIEALNRMLSATMTGDTVKITLTLKVKGAYGGGRHIVEKEYRVVTNDAINPGGRSGVCVLFEKNRLPFWAVWPYAYVNDAGEENSWKRYNFFCIEPVFRGTPIFALEPFFGDGEWRSGDRKLNTVSIPGVSDVSYRRYEKLPSAFMVSEKTDGSPLYRGMVFMAPPKTVRHNAVEWNIGLDLGTTSTTAFYNTPGDSAAHFIQLLTEYEWVQGKETPETSGAVDNDMRILCNSGPVDRNEMEHYFIDNQCLKQNGWTTTWEVMDTVHNDVNPTIFETGRIFWHNHENFRIVNTKPGRRENLLTNIKWESERSNTGKYLNQLLTQIVYYAAEKGVRKINWFFSYPTAFGLGGRGDFSERLEKLLVSLEKDTGIRQIFSERDNLLTESIAAAYYFRKQNPLEQVFLGVDIGGGTSDISLWLKTKYAFQSSVRFASRTMFVEPLKHLLERQSVMDAVRTTKNTDGIRMMLDYSGSGTVISDDKIQFFIETVLFEYYSDFKTRLDTLAGEDLAAYRLFKYQVLIAYSGLMYYLANIIARLFESGKIDKDIAAVVLGLSGKGSKMTDWIKAYCPIIYHEAEALIREKTGVAITLRDRFNAETAKTETAKGLIADLDGSGKQKHEAAEVDPEIYMGASIELTSEDGVTKNLREDDFIDTYSDRFFSKPEKLKIRIAPELPELERFIQFFNAIARQSKGDIEPIDDGWWMGHKKDLWNKIETGFENVLAEKRFDPPFVVMISVFLKEYGNG